MFSLSLVLSNSISEGQFSSGARYCAIINGRKNNLTISPPPSHYQVFLPTLYLGFHMSYGTHLSPMILLSASISDDMVQIVDRVVACCVSIVCVRLVLYFLFVATMPTKLR